MRSTFALSFLAAVARALDLPQQIHIAYAGGDSITNPDGMTVSWQTLDQTSSSIVRFGTVSGALDQTANGDSSSYSATYDHHVTLRNLKPNTRYYYQAGDDAAGWSEELSFVTAPTDSQYPLTIAIIGDMGTYNSENSIALLNKWASEGSMDFVWHLGDISYADDDFTHHPFENNYENVWNSYMNSVQGFTAKYPYMVLPGNHEAECHSPACQVSIKQSRMFANFTAYNHRFKMPYTESDGALNMWYSFNVGPVHFVNIDTETDFPNAPIDDYNLFTTNGGFGDQLSWLDTDLSLASSSRSSHPWVLVGGHRAMYTITSIDDSGLPSDTAKDVQNAFEDILYKYNTDFYFAGHVHSLERQLPVYKGVHEESYDNPTFPVHVLSGAAGCDEGLNAYKNVKAPLWNAYWENKAYAIGKLTILSDSQATWEFFNSESGELLDSFTLNKSH